MRIFSKKAFKFDHPAGQEPAVIVKSHSFADVPDWVTESAMFKLASSVGEVSVFETKQDEKAAEAEATEGRGSRGKKKENEGGKTDVKESPQETAETESEIQ
ncbi:hypothetical protein NDK47_24100 [Brevibacillus ruminantium]|uniref:Uncharacterized protein n=1 Tax=Brevibacillus ruminantium TaxID=2950604 RepID=A0ABY4WE48_9BACL|nr:hypothetical protein [Brevibacillus ruminantium]USG65169.1 hypothetical protein NDK47_24100 [Brevibacillus ruminantium]